jgi:hypothetical protein
MPKNKQTEKGELIEALQKLQTSPGWKYISNILETWKNQVLSEILEKDDNDKQKGEFTAYGRILNLPTRLLKDLTDTEVNSDLSDFDAFEKND